MHGSKGCLRIVYWHTVLHLVLLLHQGVSENNGNPEIKTIVCNDHLLDYITSLDSHKGWVHQTMPLSVFPVAVLFHSYCTQLPLVSEMAPQLFCGCLYIMKKTVFSVSRLPYRKSKICGSAGFGSQRVCNQKGAKCRSQKVNQLVFISDQIDSSRTRAHRLRSCKATAIGRGMGVQLKCTTSLFSGEDG